MTLVSCVVIVSAVSFTSTSRRRDQVFPPHTTYGYFPPVYYYQRRVRQGLKNARFANSYRAYLDIRGVSKKTCFSRTSAAAHGSPDRLRG